MGKIRIILLVLMIFMNSIFTVGCWNYREIDKLAIVAGVAIDKAADGQYKVTVEIIKISGGKESKTASETITMDGKTLFDAIRNGITLSGKKFYWSHSGVVIISKEIAREGITKVIDWYNRDSETREDAYILISQGDSAKEILNGQAVTEEIKCFVLVDMIKNQINLSKAPIVDILQFNNSFKAEGISPVAPIVKLKNVEGKMLPSIIGTGIFKEDKLIGFLNGEETKALKFIKNEVKGGVLIEGTEENNADIPVSLEIFKSKTKITPVVDGENIKINLNIDTIVAIDEIQGTQNYIDDKGRRKLEQIAEKKLKEQIEELIEKMQSEYGVDIFGFGAKLREDKAEIWKGVSSNWEEIFSDLEVNVTTNIHIRNSALLSEPLKAGD